jgi:hypothetical protein
MYPQTCPPPARNASQREAGGSRAQARRAGYADYADLLDFFVFSLSRRKGKRQSVFDGEETERDFYSYLVVEVKAMKSWRG